MIVLYVEKMTEGWAGGLAVGLRAFTCVLQLPVRSPGLLGGSCYAGLASAFDIAQCLWSDDIRCRYSDNPPLSPPRLIPPRHHSFPPRSCHGPGCRRERPTTVIVMVPVPRFHDARGAIFSRRDNCYFYPIIDDVRRSSSMVNGASCSRIRWHRGPFA